MLPAQGMKAMAWQHFFFLAGPRLLEHLLSGTLLAAGHLFSGKECGNAHISSYEFLPRATCHLHSCFIGQSKLHGQDWPQRAGASVANKIIYHGLPFWSPQAWFPISPTCRTHSPRGKQSKVPSSHCSSSESKISVWHRNFSSQKEERTGTL